ncbi:hypothetical protein [Nocardia huaxiensis]|uniref:Scramblase n=1 Tax=Nocardia huaxiensis TaxID=2755382 RepID=A0A7D6ZFF9_9NOCA|nr:hypothetical protein [Nocardia huaxiensis]QLY29639.1 hypothetical protein H0264_31065 [Nocardia huaxiensis]UFS96787.1 hypothetical protein LPY97_02315 [Nocardia huaxiensis]
MRENEPVTGHLTEVTSIDFIHPARWVEHSNFDIYDAAGRPLGSMAPIGSTWQRLAGSIREVRDPHGAVTLLLTEKVVRFRSRIQVERPGVEHLGEIVERSGWKVALELFTAGDKVGEIIADAPRSWDFRVFDAHGSQLGTIELRRVPRHGIPVRHYIIRVQLRPLVPKPLATLVFTAAPYVYRSVQRQERD